MTETASAYQRAQARGREGLRTELLDVASHLLATEGPGALTMRRIASEAGCSTTVLYTMFGGKEGIAEALYLEGFHRFRRRLESVPSGTDPLAHLYDLARAYRENALAERNYYGVMFERAIPGFTPSPDAVAAARASFDILVDAVRACLEAGVFAGGAEKGVEIAEVLWATAHGAVSLELAGYLGLEGAGPGDAPGGTIAERRYGTAVAAAGSYFLAAGGG